MKSVGKLLSFCFQLFLIGYSIYLMFKTNVDIKDVIWLTAMSLITLLTVESKCERTEESLTKVNNELSRIRSELYDIKYKQ